MWPELSTKSLVGVKMPGSHNSGADKSMRNEGRCSAVYDSFKTAIEDAAGSLKHLVTEQMLLTYFQPWNVNQNVGIYEQLSLYGVRFMHLKVCNYVDQNDRNGPYDLDHVYHTHGGYTSMSMSSILAEVVRFLEEHPMEFVVLGLNDFYEIANSSMYAESVADHLASASVALVRIQDWSKTLADLLSENRRLVVFVPDSTTEGILASADYLIENYDLGIMSSGDFNAVESYLETDAATHATLPRDKFYVMSAHPVVDLNTIDATSVFGQSSTPMQDLQQDWFDGYFPRFVDELLVAQSDLLINGISTDFVELSGSFELAMSLQSFCVTTTTTTISTATTTSWTSTSSTVSQTTQTTSIGENETTTMTSISTSSTHTETTATSTSATTVPEAATSTETSTAEEADEFNLVDATDGAMSMSWRLALPLWSLLNLELRFRA